MNKKTVADIDVKGKKCLVRLDLNVPVQDGVITDENRINGALPTVKYLLDNGAKVVMCSHLGRPYSIFSEEIKKLKPEDEGKSRAELAAKTIKKCSLKIVADRLNELLGGRVTFASDVIGESAQKAVAAVKEGEAVLLENTRFHWEEEKNVESFAKALAFDCDVFVNDAFGTAHRAHASTAGVVQYGFIKTAVSGFLIEKELKFLGGAVENPVRPFIAILGGAKVSDKIGVINSLLEKVDGLIIGGGMAYTFKKALGNEIGRSLCELDKVELAKELMDKAAAKGVKMVIPVDNVIADNFSNDANRKVVDGNIPDGWEGMDIGPKTCALFADIIKGAKTVIWNGPMGVFEFENFAVGTKAVAQALTEAKDAITIIGGGDSAAAVVQLGYGDKVTHISTGGGASLEFLEGKDLPGISCLNDR